MKIGPTTYYVIGGSVALTALAFGYFWYFRPNMQEAQAFTTYGDQLQTEANKRPQAVARRQEAIDLVNQAAQEWQGIVVRKTPPQSVGQGGINLAVNRWQLTVDARQFRNNLQRAVNAQIRKGGVKILQGPQIPAFSDSATDIVETGFNYPAFGFPVVIYELGTVTVQGSFDQISDHVQSWSSMPNYLAVTDGLRFTGTSPVLTGFYNLTILGYIRGDRVFPPVPEGAGGGAASGPAAGPAGGFGPPIGGGPPPGAVPGGPPTMGPPGGRGGRAPGPAREEDI